MIVLLPEDRVQLQHNCRSNQANVEKPHKPSVVLAGLQEHCPYEHEATVSQTASVSSEPRQPSDLDWAPAEVITPMQSSSKSRSTLVAVVNGFWVMNSCILQHCEVIGHSIRAKSHNSENTHQASWRILKCLNWFVLYLLHGVSFLGPYWSSAHGDGHINPQVTVVCKQMCDGGVKHQTVTVHDGSCHAVMDGAWRGLPGEPPPVAIELQSVGEVLGLLASSDKQHNSKELLVALVLFLLL